MSKLLGPFIPIYSDDFMGGTMDMGADEVGAYLLLLMNQWSQGYVDPDPTRIERIARCEYSRLQRVLLKFRKGDDGMLRNERMTQVRAERMQFLAKASESGKKGMAIRWGNKEVNNPPNKKRHNIPSPSPSPSPNPPPPPEKRSIATDDQEIRPLHPSRRVKFNLDSMNIEGVTDADVDAWREAYPAVDIRLEISQARQWLTANPAKRKKNVYRFLTNWFARRQERGGNVKSNKVTRDIPI